MKVKTENERTQNNEFVENIMKIVDDQRQFK